MPIPITRRTPKNLSKEVQDRFLRLAPGAVKLTYRKLGKGRIGTYVMDDDLINEAYAYGYWWQYLDKSDTYVTYIIAYDMHRRVSKLYNCNSIRGDSQVAEHSLRQVDMTDERWDMLHRVPTSVANPLDIAGQVDFFQFCAEKGRLNENEKIFLRLRFAEGLLFRQIAEQMGISHQMVTNHQKSVLYKLRKLLEGKEHVYLNRRGVV